jgi:hypothetical protein
VKEVERRGDDARHGRQSEEKRLDGNHGESWKRVSCSIVLLSLSQDCLMWTGVRLSYMLFC